jgi:hypothetical protein
MYYYYDPRKSCPFPEYGAQTIRTPFHRPGAGHEPSLRHVILEHQNPIINITAQYSPNYTVNGLLIRFYCLPVSCDIKMEEKTRDVARCAPGVCCFNV